MGYDLRVCVLIRWHVVKIVYDDQSLIVPQGRFDFVFLDRHRVLMSVDNPYPETSHKKARIADVSGCSRGVRLVRV